MITFSLSPSYKKRFLIFDKLNQFLHKVTNQAYSYRLRYRVGHLVKIFRLKYLTSTFYKRSYNHILVPYAARIRQFIYIHPFVMNAEVVIYFAIVLIEML